MTNKQIAIKVEENLEILKNDKNNKNLKNEIISDLEDYKAVLKIFFNDSRLSLLPTSKKRSIKIYKTKDLDNKKIFYAITNTLKTKENLFLDDDEYKVLDHKEYNLKKEED